MHADRHTDRQTYRINKLDTCVLFNEKVSIDPRNGLAPNDDKPFLDSVLNKISLRSICVFYSMKNQH